MDCPRCERAAEAIVVIGLLLLAPAAVLLMAISESACWVERKITARRRT